MGRNQAKFARQRRERARQKKREEKAKRRAERREERAEQSDDPDYDPDLEGIEPGPQEQPWMEDDLGVIEPEDLDPDAPSDDDDQSQTAATGQASGPGRDT